MTKTESRSPIGLDELDNWGDTEAFENGKHIAEGDIRELEVYGFDSDKRTLVGLGPVERARRARQAAEMPDSQRMPQSEPPGPFIAAEDEDDAELLRSLRGRRLSPWALALPTALLVAAAVVLTVRGFAPTQQLASPSPVAANAPRAAEPAPKPESESAPPTPTDDSGAAAQPEIDPSSLPLEPSSQSASLKTPVVPSPPPVTLPDQPSPTVVDGSNATDTSVGSLNVTSNPPANVLLDGRPLGQAPRLVQVPPGKHTVLFIHPLYGRLSLKVNVNAGQTTSASADF